jgi:hypothetical protein
MTEMTLPSQPDTTVCVRDCFGIDSGLRVPAFSVPSPKGAQEASAEQRSPSAQEEGRRSRRRSEGALLI